MTEKEKEKELGADATAVDAACPSVPAWLPIESAPKDRTILLWIPRRFPSVVVGSQWSDDDGLSWGWWAGPSLVQPTHWMPLPQPPTETT